MGILSRRTALGIATFGVLLLNSSLADDGGERQARDVATAFLKAVKGKDVDATLKLCGTPWLDSFEERVIKDRAELVEMWKEKFQRLVPSRIPDAKWTMIAYARFREPPAKTGDVEFDAAARKIHDEVVRDLDRLLDRGGWIVKVTDENEMGGMFILVRSRGGKMEVVGGPAGSAYIDHASRIPVRARTMLDRPEKFELLSLDPKPPKEKPEDDFHGWVVLGKTEISQPATRRKVVNALKQSAEEADGTFAGCFNPRHGIRVKHAGKSVDFVICFECRMTLIYFDGESEDKETGFQTTRTAQPEFDDVFRAAKVPLAEPRRK